MMLPGRNTTMEMTRRSFLSLTAALGLTPIPRVLLRAAEGLTAAPEERVLVVLQLTGGNDGLNMVVPFEEPAYHKNRPTLAIARGQALPLGHAGGGHPGSGPGGAEIGFHPRMTGLRDLYREGAVAVVQGVGYPNPSRSHFRSMDIWHTAQPEVEETRVGWLGKAVAGNRGRLPALDVGDERLPLALQGEVQVPTLQNLDWVDYLATERGHDLRRRLQALHQRPRDGEVERVRSLALATLGEMESLIELRRRPVPVEYPSSHLADRLQWIGQLIGGGFSSRIYYLSHGGFDTHAQEKDLHALLLAQLSEGLSAFQRHLRALGAAERVVVMVFSEFGRRVRENGSLGTDHGCAAPVLLVSGGIRGGLHGPHPRFDDLEEGDLRFHTDFRRVYATLLEEVLGTRSEPVLGGPWEKLDLFPRRLRV
jgi:uncharacterized protein (DUF1501 family)